MVFTGDTRILKGIFCGFFFLGLRATLAVGYLFIFVLAKISLF